MFKWLFGGKGRTRPACRHDIAVSEMLMGASAIKHVLLQHGWSSESLRDAEYGRLHSGDRCISLRLRGKDSPVAILTVSILNGQLIYGLYALSRDNDDEEPTIITFVDFPPESGWQLQCCPTPEFIFDLAPKALGQHVKRRYGLDVGLTPLDGTGDPE